MNPALLLPTHGGTPHTPPPQMVIDPQTGVVSLVHPPVVPGEAHLPPLHGWDYLTTWGWETAPAVSIAVLAALYSLGVWRLHRRGVRWSPWRSLAFLAGGLGMAAVASFSSLAVYDTTLLWMHMVQHMILSMAVPIFLALGAPVTLALRTLPAKPRQWLLVLLHSRYARVVSFPLVGGALFVATPFVLYFSSLYEATLRHPWLHDLNHGHFVAVGCLWFFPLVGLDPVPGRLPYLMRMLAMTLALPFHAFLGIAIMTGADHPPLIAQQWYSSLGRTWGPTLAQDQQIAGGILWGTGDAVGLLLAGVLFLQWVRQSQREAAREDRHLDRLEAAQASTGAPAAPWPAAGVEVLPGRVRKVAGDPTLTRGG